MLGRHFTEEHRKHMSEARKGIPRPDMKGRKPWNKGTKGMFHHTEEWKKEQSKRSKGRKMSEEAKRKLSESAKKRTSYSFTGHHHTEESKQKIRLAHLGKGHTEETKKVLSEKAKQQWASYTEEQRKLFKAQLLEARKKITYKKGRTPWNKGKKGCQVAWNKGKKGCQVAWNKGKKFTEEQRKHMSEAQLKYYSDPMHAPWNKGKTGVQVAWNKGKNLTEEHRKHLVEAKRRRKNLNETGKN